MMSGNRSQGFRRIVQFVRRLSTRAERTLRYVSTGAQGFGQNVLFCGSPKKQKGFTIVEMVLACAIFPMIVIGLSQGYDAIRRSYTISKQLNEMYAVLSACPEIDRALVYDSVSSSTNCYPNNTFLAEGGGTSIITYTPTVTVTDTTALVSTDPLKTVPDSKVINISVGFQKNVATKLQLRMLITRGGIGQQ